MFTSRRHKATPAVVKGQMHIVLITAPCPKDHPSQCHSHKFKWQKSTDLNSTHAFCLQQLSGQATLPTFVKTVLLKTGARLTRASSAYACGRRRMWVGEEMKHRHSGGTTQSNNFRTILFNVLPLLDVFLSPSPSLPAIYHHLLSCSPSSRLQLRSSSWPTHHCYLHLRLPPSRLHLFFYFSFYS